MGGNKTHLREGEDAGERGDAALISVGRVTPER